jgi:hypothetical protein
MRAELEARLRSATALSDEQRKAILDQFCKKEEEQENAHRWFDFGRCGCLCRRKQLAENGTQTI